MTNDGDDLRRSLERLVKLGETRDVDIKPVLLRVLVDMFARKAHHAPSDLAQFEEMLVPLLDKADEESRQLVAEKLARHPCTPRSIIERLLDGPGNTAAPFLEHAIIAPETQVATAALGPTEAALLLARRRDLDPAAIKQLAERPETDVLLALVGNGAAKLDRPTLHYLVRRASDNERLGRALLKRGDEPADLVPLFLWADREQREAMLLAAAREDLAPMQPRPKASAAEAAALARVERSLLSPDRDGFDANLAAALGIGLSDVWRIVDDPYGEPLALALAAIGATPELAARVFILSGPAIGHSVMVVRKLTKLVETIPAATARRLVVTMSRGAARPPRRHPHQAEPTGRIRSDMETRAIHAVPRLDRKTGGSKASGA